MSTINECRLFTIDVKVNGNFIHFFCHESIKLSNDLEIAKMDALNTVSPIYNEKLNAGNTPLDIDVDRQMNVFIALNTNKNWRFSPNSSAIALKPQRQPKAVYGTVNRLLHPGKTDCKIIHFSVNPPKEDYDDEFNFFVDILDGNKILPIIIDPDIRHPGGTQ